MDNTQGKKKAKDEPQKGATKAVYVNRGHP